jgi:hypothetical protein
VEGVSTIPSKKFDYHIASAAVLLFLCLFYGYVLPAFGAEEVSPATFGQGKIQVRLYTDYFCKPCRALEPKMEPLIKELTAKNTVTITFVDTPFYNLSSLYARYFLYAMKKKGDIEHFFRVKEALFEASKMNIDSGEKIEAFLRSKNIECTAFDVKPVFAQYGNLLKEDGIERTPSCVICKNGNIEKLTGSANILNALSSLRGQ